MSTIEAKVGGSLNKIQGTIQQGKQKMQIAQEISQLSEQVEKLKQKRLESILEIGNEVHRRIRLGEFTGEVVLITTAQNIEELDKQIYSLSTAVQDLKVKSDEGLVCSNCQTSLQPGDKFCGSCGNPAPVKAEVAEALKVCNQCETEIPVSAAFCPCCGVSA